MYHYVYIIIVNTGHLPILIHVHGVVIKLKLYSFVGLLSNMLILLPVFKLAALSVCNVNLLDGLCLCFSVHLRTYVPRHPCNKERDTTQPYAQLKLISMRIVGTKYLLYAALQLWQLAHALHSMQLFNRKELRFNHSQVFTLYENNHIIVCKRVSVAFSYWLDLSLGLDLSHMPPQHTHMHMTWT